MKLVNNIMTVVTLLMVVPVYTAVKNQRRGQVPGQPVQRQQSRKKTGVRPQQRQAVKQQQAPGSMVQQSTEWQPAVVAKEKLSMEDYVNKKVNALQGNLINDIFPKKDTIERIVLDFKEEYPGPDKDSDTVLIYEAIMNNPAIKKMISLENGVQIYKLVRGTIDEVWTRQDEAIWAR